MKSRLNTALRILLYYPSGVNGTPVSLSAPQAVVKNPDGTTFATVSMAALTELSSVYRAATTITPLVVGDYTIEYQDNDTGSYVTFLEEPLHVTVDPSSDFLVSTVDLPKFVLPAAEIGNTTSVVKLKVLDEAGLYVTDTAAAASHTGTASIATLNLVPTLVVDQSTSSGTANLVFSIDDGANQTSTLTGTFGGRSSASAGAFAGNISDGDSIVVSIDGGPNQTVSFTGVEGASEGYFISILNAYLTGCSVRSDSNVVTISSDTLGKNSSVEVVSLSANVATDSGLTVGTSDNATAVAASTFNDFTAVTATQLVAILTLLTGLTATVSSDNKLILTGSTGTTDQASTLSLVSGTAALIILLGLSGLGVQGSNTVATGTAANEFLATVANNVYIASTPNALSTEGNYILQWLDDGVLSKVEILSGLIPRGAEACTLSLTYSSGVSAVIHPGVTVCVSDAAGNRIDQSITDSAGSAGFTLPPASYIASIKKDSLVFSLNNFAFEVLDKQTFTATATNKFAFKSDYFSPTFETFSSSIPLCTLYAYLREFDGKPMRHTDIKVTLEQGPQNYTGVTAFGHTKIYKTDYDGYVTFDLIQGVTITVSIMSHSLRRTITVPSGAAAASPVNLMTLLSAASDPFDILVVDLPAAPRRSI